MNGQITSMIAYKFVNHDIHPLSSFINCFEYRMKVKLLSGEELTREEKNQLASRLSTSSEKRTLKIGGWAFTFTELVNEYWVEFTYGDIHRYYAPDKTSLRACLSSVSRIVEVTKAKQFA